MEISIAMCTCNGASYLPIQLESISKQSRKPDEIIICDDMSSDNTKDIVYSFASTTDIPVRIIKNPIRLGSTANFSKAISLCQGDIIVLSDQDDVWLKDKLAILEQHFASNSLLGGMFSNAELIDQYGKKQQNYLWNAIRFGSSEQNALRKGHGLDILLQGNFVTGATLAFRSCWTGLVLPIPSRWIHDHWIALLLSAASRLDFEPRPLIQYRCHPAQQLGVRNGYQHDAAGLWHRLMEIDNATYLQAAASCDEVTCRLSKFDAINLSKVIIRCNRASTHFRSRGTLPAERVKRIPALLHETVNGNYFRHSLGIKSILRDLLSDFRHGTYL